MTEYTAPDASVTSPTLGLWYNAIPFVGTSADITLVNLYNVNNLWVNNITSVTGNLYINVGYLEVPGATVRATSLIGDVYTNNISIDVVFPPDPQVITVNYPFAMTNHEIQNVGQTTTITSAATNAVVPQTYSNTIDGTTFSNTGFTQLLISLPVVKSFQNPNNVFTNIWQVTFSFSGNTRNSDTVNAFYFTLYNNTQLTETIGKNFTSTSSYCISKNYINISSISASYTDAYDLSTWNDQEEYYIYLYIRGNTQATNYFTNGSYNVFLQPTLSY
jgi:hypothetical protein